MDAVVANGVLDREDSDISNILYSRNSVFVYSTLACVQQTRNSLFLETDSALVAVARPLLWG